MSWNPDEAREALFRAVLVLQETHGEKETIGLLRDELTRLTVVRDHKQNAAAVAKLTKRNATLEQCLNAAVDALGYYADADNYIDRPGKQSAVRKDKGDIASEAIASIRDATEDTSEEGGNV